MNIMARYIQICILSTFYLSECAILSDHQEVETISFLWWATEHSKNDPISFPSWDQETQPFPFQFCRRNNPKSIILWKISNSPCEKDTCRENKVSDMWMKPLILQPAQLLAKWMTQSTTTKTAILSMSKFWPRKFL